MLETDSRPRAARRRALLKQFGGLQGILRAGVDDLVQVRGIGRPLAQPSTITCILERDAD